MLSPPMRPRRDRRRLSRPPLTPAPLRAPRDRESSGNPAGPGQEWGARGDPASPPQKGAAAVGGEGRGRVSSVPPLRSHPALQPVPDDSAVRGNKGEIDKSLIKKIQLNKIRGNPSSGVRSSELRSAGPPRFCASGFSESFKNLCLQRRLRAAPSRAVLPKVSRGCRRFGGNKTRTASSGERGRARRDVQPQM